MKFTNVKTEIASILREVATDIEAGWFESKSVEELFQEIEGTVRYYLGRKHGNELRYLDHTTPLSTLQSLHQVSEKKKLRPEVKKKSESTDKGPDDDI